MGLKAVLENLDGVNEGHKALYKQGDGGKFYLEIDGVDELPQFQGMRRAKEQERDAHNNVANQLREAKAKIDELQNNLDDIHRGNVAKGDVEKLEQSWKDKLARKEAELTTQLTDLQKQVKTLLVDNVAQSLASKISTAPELLLPHITKRLAVETENGQLVTRVLDNAGKLSASSLEDLEKEFVTNKTFAPIIIGTKAGGSGASGGGGGGGANKKFSELSEKERTELYNRDPDEYRRRRDAERQS